MTTTPTPTPTTIEDARKAVADAVLKVQQSAGSPAAREALYQARQQLNRVLVSQGRRPK